jgi:hypothetical protein
VELYSGNIQCSAFHVHKTHRVLIWLFSESRGPLVHKSLVYKLPILLKRYIKSSHLGI